MVIWLTGISGSGKTTLARKLILLKLKDRFPNILNVDGDEVRELFGDNLGYSLEDRILQIEESKGFLII